MAVINMNYESFDRNIVENEKLVLVEFWAPWCVYCRRIAPVYEKIAEKFEHSVIVGKVNIDENPELAEKENIEVIPTLILYKRGIAIDAIVAPESKAKIEEFIYQHMDK